MDTNTANKDKSIIHKKLSYSIVGCLFRAQNELGRYARENQYGDLLEIYFSDRELSFVREKKISKTENDINRADFVINDIIVLELKSKPFIERADYYQVKRYLEFENLQLGIIVNFRQRYLKPKRILNSSFDKKK